MEYNSQRPKMKIPEYGRYIQQMVAWAVTVEDDEKRNAIARQIIDLMSMMNPQFKNIEEYKHKLWDHLIMISDFKLVVDSPYPFPERRDVVEHSDKPLPYPKHKIRMKHYGRNFENLVAKAPEFDEEKRKGLSIIAANYMKLCYTNWSKDNVSDGSLRQDLETISKGLLSVPEDYTFIAPEREAPVQNFNNHRSPQTSSSFKKNKKRKFSRFKRR